MAADDEFPRGLHQIANAGSTNEPAITYPAIAGLSWVLTSINYSLFGAAGADQEAITVNGVQWPVAVSASGGEAGNGSWTGQAGFPADTAVTITATGAGANRFANLDANAYAI